jgi:hypothetical protein
MENIENIDDLIAQMEADELEDKAQTTTHLTPIEYAKLHNMRPQKVYYAIRHKKLEVEKCMCGRKVINIATADEYFGFKKEGPEEDGEEGSD